ncbi:DUF397 domain-containing protein [Streptomyces sp. AM 2-1-1]|uniref:DUF397 domain-containing protein n=1 Tax=unclassified Streptomyces TaxID=2593676 RepID=UPI0023B8CE89|nr:DUF397 domain-containing protein [Streptomyces sp. AM 2-1-1]WEH40308.1 DUF397 domain-containing protein [Streptomyces sp. AM 2-1-1]
MTPASSDLRRAAWRKSSFSDGGPNNCLEVSDDFPGLVPVRDSKNPAGPALLITAPAWTAFVAFAAGR